MKIVKTLLIALSLTAFIASCTQEETSSNSANSSPPSNTEAPEVTSTPKATDDVAEGKKHYTEHCVKCHKEDGTGGEVEIEGRKLKPDNLTSAKMIKEPDEEYLMVLKDGIDDEGMPSFKKILTEEQMKQVVKYIRAELQK